MSVRAPKLVASGLLAAGESRRLRCDVPRDWHVRVVLGGEPIVWSATAHSSLAFREIEVRNASDRPRPFALVAVEPGTAMAAFHAAGFLKTIFG